MVINENEIRKAIAILKPDNQLFEIRIINKQGYITSGYFNNADTLISELKKHSNEDSSVYISLQFIDKAVESREQFGKLIQTKGKMPTTSDSDILGYSYLFIDLDPQRIAGTSSTDEELNESRELGNKICSFMQTIGFCKPLIAESGNGIHLLYKISLKNNKENAELIKQVLKTLDMFLSTDNVKVDCANFNPSRICKLYGTMANKGRNSSNRPHRMSRIISVPEEFRATDVGYLKKLVGLQPEVDKPHKYNNYSPSEFDVEEWMNKFGIRYKRSTYSDGDKYILDCCPFNSNHKGKDACVMKRRDGGLAFHCFHNECADKGWKDVRLLFEPDAYEKKHQEQEIKMYKSFNRNKIKESKTLVEKADNPIFLTAKNIFDIPKVEESFVRTGIIEIDKKIRGLKKGFVSVWSGLRGSAKSTVLSQITLNAIDEGNNVGFYSGELSPKNFMRWMNLQACGKSKVQQGKYEGYYNVPYDIQKQIAEWMEGHFWLYNNDYGNDSKAILQQLEKTIVDKKLDLLILDNLMAFDLSTLNDNKWDGQKDFVWELHKMAQKYDVHISFVAHPRKAMGFLRLDDISGSSDIANAVEYAFIVHRNNYDFKRMTSQMFGWKENNEIYLGTNVIEICKDRDGGTQDCFVPLHYEVESKRLKNYKTENVIYGWDITNDGFVSAEDITLFDEVEV